MTVAGLWTEQNILAAVVHGSILVIHNVRNKIL